MRNLATAVIALGCMAGTSAATARDGGYMFCEAEYRSSDEVYISNVFYVSSFYDSDISDSFKKFIDSRYSPDGTIYDVTCEGNLEDSKRDAEDSLSEEMSSWRDRDYEVRRVRWSY